MSTPALSNSPTLAYVRAWKPGDEVPLASALREEDKQEIFAATGGNALTALQLAAHASLIACSIVDSRTDRVVGLFGAVVSPVRDEDGIVWLLGTNALTEPGMVRQLMQEAQRYVCAFHSRFSRIYTYVDARNAAHVRWLQWLGFSFVKRHELYGFEHRPFLEFARTNERV